MGFSEEITNRLVHILDNPDEEISFGNGDFTIHHLQREGSGYVLTCLLFLHGSTKYQFEDFEGLCDGLRRIYGQFGKTGVPRRLLADLEQALT
jgi:hypothetical protein